jgi:hypothetical protein
MTQRTLELSKFNMRSIVFPKDEAKAPIIVMIGKRDTGKSVLIHDLLYYHQDIPVATVISGTEQGNGFYSSIVPRIFIHNQYNSEIIAKILNRQKLQIKQILKDQKEFNKKSTMDARTVLVMDDCLYDNSWAKDVLMRTIFLNGRHWKTMLILTMQYPLGIPPIMRTNIDYVFILRENIDRNRRIIWQNYASMFPTYEGFCTIMDQCTENYECLVVHNGSKSNKISDQIFWYKADLNKPSYKLGAQHFWDLSAQLEDEEDEEEEYGPNHNGKKKKESVVVKKKSW